MAGCGLRINKAVLASLTKARAAKCFFVVILHETREGREERYLIDVVDALSTILARFIRRNFTF